MRFLWQVSRIDLSLIPTHPDRVGGLGFLANSAFALMPLAVAHGALLSGWIANRIFHLGAVLPDFKIEIAIFVIIMQVVVLGPLGAFAPRLAEANIGSGLRRIRHAGRTSMRGSFDTHVAARRRGGQ